MKKLLTLLIVTSVFACSKKNDDCVWSNGQGDYWKSSEFTKAQVKAQCSCEPVLECK